VTDPTYEAYIALVAMATLQPDFPLVRRLTSNGTLSLLEALFDPNGPFPVQKSVLSDLTNEDYNAMRATKRSINETLTERAPYLPPGAAPRWRNQRYMIVKCDEQACAGTADTTTFIKACEDCTRSWGGVCLMCAGCRYNNHWNPPTGFPGAPTRHNLWMTAISSSKGRVCAKCDREQHRSYPQGFDGCTCFRDRYSSVWICNHDDNRRCSKFVVDKGFRAHTIRLGWQCTTFGPHFVINGPFHTRPSCLCVREYIPLSRPEPRDTQQCRMCFGFTVPSSRRSERVRQARGGNTSVPSFQMLAARGRGKIATRRVNRHGFSY